MLESYIAPLFMGYVDKYIKNLKPSDLSLSIWGGDAVLHNLELNLDVLQEELNLPVKFLSGKIYKLQIHVPWTRLVYEPVVITIDTMEFVVKLKDSSDCASNFSEKVSHEDLEREIESARSHETEQLPPGYVQSILNKVINNVSFKINNIIIKYIEDDMVLSLNIKCVNFYSADKDWKQAFVELSLPDLLLHKVCDITDVTICLDQQNSSGRIELYQDPVLYKCNLTCRILSRYKGLSSTKPVENKIHIHCESLDFSLTDYQMTMVMRLLQLVMGLYYGTLDLPGCKYKKHTAPKIIENHKKEKTRLSTSAVDVAEPNMDSSWSAWAWSMVPAYGSDNQQAEQEQSKEDIKNSFGIYVNQTTLTLKKTNHLSDLLSQRLEFSPVMYFECSGCVLEFVSIGDLLIDICVGIQRVMGYTIGKECVCTETVETTDESFDELQDTVDEVFLQCGINSVDLQSLSYLKLSLFNDYITGDENSIQDQTFEHPNSSSEISHSVETKALDVSNENDVTPNINWLETGNEEKTITTYNPGPMLTEEEITNRYGSIFVNYFYEMKLPTTISNEIENIFLFPDTDETVPETSEKRLCFSNCRLFISSKLVHAVIWLKGVVTKEIPQRKEKEGIFQDPFVMQQLQLGNFLSRKTTLSCNNSELFVYTKDHEEKKFKTSTSQLEKESVSFQLDHFSLVKVDPMYPAEIIQLVKSGKLVQLKRVENLNTNISIQMEGFQTGISSVTQESMETFSVMLLQPTDFNLNVNSSILPDTTGLESSMMNAEYKFQCDAFSLVFTKIHLLLFYEILYSWKSSETKHFIPSYLNNVFQHQGTPKRSGAPVLNMDFVDINLHFMDMISLHCLNVSLSRASASIQSVASHGGIESSIILQCPENTENISNISSWLTGEKHKEVERMAFTMKLQYLKTKNVSDKFSQLIDIYTSGITLNVDPLLLAWISYQVDFQVKRKVRPPLVRHQSTSIMNQSITTPRRNKSYARGDNRPLFRPLLLAYGSNTSSHSKEKLDQPVEIDHVDDNDEKEKGRFGEWLAHKINFFKSFHVKVELNPLIFILPKERWPSDCSLSNHIDMINHIYHSKNSSFPSTLVICLPKVNINSSNSDEMLFQQPFPVLINEKRKRLETLPWTVNSKDMTAFCLFSNMEQINTDEKIENFYILKPVSWSLFVGSTTQSKIPRVDSQLSVITENNQKKGEEEKTKHFSHGSVWLSEKSYSDGKTSLGFVLHMDWSICEVNISQKMLKLGSHIFTYIYRSTQLSHGVRGKQHTFVPPLQGNDTVIKENGKPVVGVKSVSSASTIDHVDAFSTITGSSNVIGKHKKSLENINVSLWIQCTLPKVKCTFLSKVTEDTDSYYQVVSEIEEIMFAFDYQDNVLELTNKIASCIVYYSLLRFDTEPLGWTVVDDGYLLCQKEKSKEVLHPDSKTLLSCVYRCTYQLSQTIMSPDESIVDAAKKNSDTAVSLPSTVLQLHDEHIIKHEITMHVLSFDLICYTKPILSSIAIFMDLLPAPVTSGTNLKATLPSDQTVKSVTQPFDHGNSVITLPLMTFHCDTVRVIIPVGVQQKFVTSNQDQEEYVFVLHLQSIDINSSPTNPITKTVTDKALYRHAKLNYCETLKKLKLWNVQYQLDILNIGLCTTNWQSLEKSLPAKFKKVQNPALEWNSKLGNGQALMTPIFPGFDLKATMAPPIILKLPKQMHPVTAAAFELHSPREVKLFLNSCQIGLAMQVMNDINTLLSEVSELFLSNTTTHLPPPTSLDTDTTADSGVFPSERSPTQNKVSYVLPAVELFASVSCISIMLYHKELIEPLISTLYPTLLLNITQPTCSITTLKEKKIVLSVSNVDVTTSSKYDGLKGDHIVPSFNEFNVSILKCGSGIVDQKTGLMPAFLNISAILENENEVYVNADIGRSLTLSYSACQDKNIRLFFTHLLTSLKSGSNNMNTEPRVNIPENKENKAHLLPVFKRFSFSTKRCTCKLAPSLDEEYPVINMQYESVTTDCNLAYNSNGGLDKIKSQNDVRGLCVFFEEENERKSTVIQHFNSTLAVLAHFCSHSGNLLGESIIPRLYLWFNTGPIRVNCNQHVYQLLLQTSQHISQLFTSSKTPLVEEQGGEEEEKEKVISTVPSEQTSVDDLRSGLFEYILQNECHKDYPDVNQILFSPDNSSPPMMTWKYNEARAMEKVTIFPVPFHVSNDVRSGWINDEETIPCLLEYWDELSHGFVLADQFYLSESEASSIIIDENHSCYRVTSQLWRVVVTIPEKIGSHHEDSKKVVPMVPSTSLAACMKVDSLISTKHIPSLQLKLAIDMLKIDVGNTVNDLGLASPTKLIPCYLEDTDDSCPDIYEAIDIIVDDVKLQINMLNDSSVSFDCSSMLNINILDYNDLCWKNLMNPTKIEIDTSYLLCSPLTESNVDLNIGETELIISQTAIHTLTQTARAWGDVNKEQSERIIFNHYLLCNKTQDVLHLQQITTDEDIILRSGQAYPYSWCNTQNKHALRFCIENIGDWKWSEPIDLNELGIKPFKLFHSGHSSQLFVEVKSMGGLQKQVIFHGSCSLVNNLNFDVQIEVVTQEFVHNKVAVQNSINDISKKFVLPANISRPSLTVATSFIKCLKVMKSESPLVVISPEDDSLVTIPMLIKDEEENHNITLKEGTKVYHVWLSLSYSSKILGHLVISLSPLFILRSHLAEPVLIRLDCPDKEEERYDMVLQGRGREMQIFSLGVSTPFMASFCLAGSKEYSKPPYLLNTIQSEVLRQEPKTLCSLLDQNWPYSENGASPIASHNKTGQKVSYTSAHHKEEKQDQESKEVTRTWQQADLIFQSSLRWADLPTILVDLKPWILVTNLAASIFEIRCNDTGYVYALDKNETISPIHIKSSFSLGLLVDGWKLWSNPITVTNKDDISTPTHEDQLRPGCFCHCTIVNKSTTECYQYALTCVENDNILTVGIQERFVLHNLSDFQLCFSPMMSDDNIAKEKMYEKLKLKNLPSKSQEKCALLNVHTKAEKLPTGLIVGFHIQNTIKAVQPSTAITENIYLAEKLTLHKHECLMLSEDHLRECITLKDFDNNSFNFVLTSSLEDGIIHVFIDKDYSPIVLITNATKLNLVVKETEQVSKQQQQMRHEVLCDDKEQLIVLPACSEKEILPYSFKQMFPKCNNLIEWHCQFAVDSGENTVELSRPVLLKKDTSTKLFIPGHGELYVKAIVIYSHLQVMISENEHGVLAATQPLSYPAFDLQLSSFNVLIVDYQYSGLLPKFANEADIKLESLMSVSLANFRIFHQCSLNKSLLKITLGYLQLDNQLLSSCYHFPVVFLPMRQLSERYHSVTKDAPFPEVEACLDADFCTLTFEAGQLNHQKFVDNIRVNVQPCEMYLEDTFVYRLAAVVDSYTPPTHTQSDKILKENEAFETFHTLAKSIMHPLRLCNVEINELSVLLSVHASVKLFLAADHIPLALGRYKSEPTQTISQELLRSILYHYATQALVRVGWILGSLELIGNPTGLIQNIGRGISDFFLLPYNGLIRGPTAFVSGVGSGMSSFLKHISTGALTSINNVSSSVSRNMDRLCFDETHLLLQEERRALTPTRVSSGFRNAFGSLGMSLLGAVAGIVDHPIQNLSTANNTKEAINGVVSGFAKGMVGIVTKPIGGAMEFISQTSQGILQGAGLVKTPERVVVMSFNQLTDIGSEESQMKLLWQYLHLQSSENIFFVSDVIIKHVLDIQKTSCGTVILTDAAIFVYLQDTGNITYAFPLKEVQLTLKEVEDCEANLSCFRISKLLPDTPSTQTLSRTATTLDQNPNFRQFFESFQTASATSHVEALCEVLTTDHILELELLSSFGDLLQMHYNAKKMLLEEEMYTLNSLEL